MTCRIPGQKWPWLIRGYYEQDYAGGGNYQAVGAFGPGYNDVRLRPAN